MSLNEVDSFHLRIPYPLIAGYAVNVNVRSFGTRSNRYYLNIWMQQMEATVVNGLGKMFCQSNHTQYQACFPIRQRYILCVNIQQWEWIRKKKMGKCKPIHIHIDANACAREAAFEKQHNGKRFHLYKWKCVILVFCATPVAGSLSESMTVIIETITNSFHMLACDTYKSYIIYRSSMLHRHIKLKMENVFTAHFYQMLAAAKTSFLNDFSFRRRIICSMCTNIIRYLCNLGITW